MIARLLDLLWQSPRVEWALYDTVKALRTEPLPPLTTTWVAEA